MKVASDYFTRPLWYTASLRITQTIGAALYIWAIIQGFVVNVFCGLGTIIGGPISPLVWAVYLGITSSWISSYCLLFYVFAAGFLFCVLAPRGREWTL